MLESIRRLNGILFPRLDEFRACQKTESMVTPVFATPILTTSWLA
nr:Glycerol dehydrogenase [uncultured bacterium]